MSRPAWPLAAVLALMLPHMGMAQALFDLVDTDGDGGVSRAELDAARMERFLALDRNGDGMVDRSELMVGPGQGRKGYSAEETQGVLAAYDRDGDGLITREEVEEAIERLNIFSTLDVDQDGLLTRQEAEGVLDIRPRGGLGRTQILDDLGQGKRTTAGFRPLADPFETARAQAIPPTATSTDLQSARQDGWAAPAGPSVWAHPDHPGVVDLSKGMPPTAHMAQSQTNQGQNEYVARRLEPLHAGSMDPYLRGAVPPGPMGGTPIFTPGGAREGANWRLVD